MIKHNRMKKLVTTAKKITENVGWLGKKERKKENNALSQVRTGGLRIAEQLCYSVINVIYETDVITNYTMKANC